MRTMHIHGLIDQIISDIREFVERQQELMFNEGDFQLQLAVFLRQSGNYDDVQVEYYIPNDLAANAGYDWDSNLYIDIVCAKDGEYSPVELKYPTRLVTRDARRFGTLLKDVHLMRNQGAQDIVRYNFWKDVRRCEIIRHLFPAVKNGVAVMLTNDASYTRPVRSTSACFPFSTAEGSVAGGGVLGWQGNPTVSRNHTPFVLDGTYRVEWSEHTIDDEKFYLTIIKI